MPQIRRHALHAATTYLVMQKAAIHVDGCNLLDTRGGDNCNNDGFFGAASFSIRKSLISTSDDAVKVCHDIRIENVTIGFDHQDAHALRLFYTVPLADKYNAMGMLGMHDLFEDRQNEERVSAEMWTFSLNQNLGGTALDRLSNRTRATL